MALRAGWLGQREWGAGFQRGLEVRREQQNMGARDVSVKVLVGAFPVL